VIRYLYLSYKYSEKLKKQSVRSVINLVLSFNKISIMLVDKLECLLLTGEAAFDALCQRPLCLRTARFAAGIGSKETLQFRCGLRSQLFLDGPNAL
jgi:hypothetical protein